MSVLAFAPCAQAQTLGGIVGTVTDKTGSVLPDTTVTIVGDQTKLTRTQKSSTNGAYDFVDLPIGTYTLTFTHEGFQTQRMPSITVQADRSATVNAILPVGQVSSVVEVQADPLMNAVDTTNGYILEKEQIDSIPLPTGSFTGLAILSPGVNAELPNGTGANFRQQVVRPQVRCASAILHGQVHQRFIGKTLRGWFRARRDESVHTRKATVPARSSVLPPDIGFLNRSRCCEPIPPAERTFLAGFRAFVKK